MEIVPVLRYDECTVTFGEPRRQLSWAAPFERIDQIRGVTAEFPDLGLVGEYYKLGLWGCDRPKCSERVPVS